MILQYFKKKENDYKKIADKTYIDILLKSKNIKYLFYQPWVDILIEDDWYEKNDKKDISTYSNRLNEVYTNIDKKFVVGPEFKNSEGYNSYKIAFEEMRHPNKSEQEVISKFIEEKI